MSAQTSFRLPGELSRALSRLARQRRVPKSQVVREALERYLAAPDTPPAPMMVRERSAPYIGAVRLDAAHDAGDTIAATIRQNNWRD
jgi:hypothetical protein